MMRRGFGTSGAALPVLGLGCSRIGSLGNPAPMRDIRALLERSLELGVNLFDTADIYGQGDSEQPADLALAIALAVYVGRVEQIDAELQ